MALYLVYDKTVLLSITGEKYKDCICFIIPTFLCKNTSLYRITSYINRMKPKKKNIDKISAPKLAEEYVVIADYSKEDKWDLNLQAGMLVEVVEKSESGKFFFFYVFMETDVHIWKK